MVRLAIMGCGDTAETTGAAKAKEVADADLARLAEGGMTVAAPSDQLKTALDGFARTIAEEWLQRAGGEGRAVLEAYRKE